MNPYLSTKQILKQWRWVMRRWAAQRRWGREAVEKAPIVFGNAMPKSGSHLIFQVLQGLTRLGPFINTGFPPANRSEDNQKMPEGVVLANLKSMRPGDIGYGYIPAKEPFISLLTGKGWATIFVYRDPRDQIISHVFYATEMHAGHGMHRYYTEKLHNLEERIQAAILGVEEQGSELSPVRKKYERYLGWLEQPAVLCLRFEDLILQQPYTLGRLLDFLAQRGFQLKYDRTYAIEELRRSIAPQKSGTFRKGKPGNWQEYFSEANKALFKEMTGDLLLRLGYEADDEW